MVVNVMTEITDSVQPIKEVNKGGRPFGSKETPGRVIESELRNSVKTIQYMREMIEGQVDGIEKQLNKDKDLTIEIRLMVCERLAIVMSNLTKNVETLGKYSIGDANRRKVSDNDTGDTTNTTSNSKQIMSLLGGRS